MAGNRDFKITIENNVTVNQAGSTVVGGVQIPTNPMATDSEMNPVATITGGSSAGKRALSVGGAISAQFMVSAASRLLNASGNQQMAKTVGDVGRYAFLGVRALSGDPSAIAGLALEIATDAWEMARKNAEQANESDETQIRAGLMNMNGITVRKEFWTGRYIYSRE